MKRKSYNYGSFYDFLHMLPKSELDAFKRYYVEQYIKSLIVEK